MKKLDHLLRETRIVIAIKRDAKAELSRNEKPLKPNIHLPYVQCLVQVVINIRRFTVEDNHAISVNVMTLNFANLPFKI